MEEEEEEERLINKSFVLCRGMIIFWMRMGLQSPVILTIGRERTGYTALGYFKEGFLELALMPKT